MFLLYKPLVTSPLVPRLWLLGEGGMVRNIFEVLSFRRKNLLFYRLRFWTQLWASSLYIYDFACLFSLHKNKTPDIIKDISSSVASRIWVWSPFCLLCKFSCKFFKCNIFLYHECYHTCLIYKITYGTHGCYHTCLYSIKTFLYTAFKCVFKISFRIEQYYLYRNPWIKVTGCSSVLVCSEGSR